jgi:hypothetical protein
LPKHIGTDMDDQGFIRLAGLLRIKYIFTWVPTIENQ